VVFKVTPKGAFTYPNTTVLNPLCKEGFPESGKPSFFGADILLWRMAEPKTQHFGSAFPP
jgi:hypothetical protein